MLKNVTKALDFDIYFFPFLFVFVLLRAMDSVPRVNSVTGWGEKEEVKKKRKINLQKIRTAEKLRWGEPVGEGAS